MQAQSPTADLRLGIPALAKAPDTIWIETLIDQELPDLAVDVTQFRYNRATPDSNAQAQWLMLLMHAQSMRQLQNIDWSNPSPILQSLLEELRKFQLANPKSPRLPWIQWKKIWCRRFINQRVLAAYLAVPGRKHLQEWLLQSIRNGLEELDQLEQIALKLQPDKPILNRAERTSPSAVERGPNAEITSREILDLRGDIELLRADLLHQRSQSYNTSDDERIAAATQMLSAIDRAASQLPATWTHRPLLRIAQAEAELQLDRQPSVQKNLDELWLSLEKESNPEVAGWRSSIASLAIRAARSKSQWDLVDNWMKRAGGWTNHPELALEHAATLIQRDLVANPTGKDPVTPETMLALKKDIGRRFGQYWEQRVDSLLVSNPLFKTIANTSDNNPNPNANASSMASLELFRIEARQAIAAKKIDLAIEKLQQAEAIASKSNATEDAVTFGLQIAALLQNSGQRSSASDEFYRTAISYPNSKKSPSAALMSAWLIREPDPKGDADANDIQRRTYLDRLRETSLLWPDTEPSNRATLLIESEWIRSGNWITWGEHCKESLATKPTVSRLHQAIACWLWFALVTQDDWLEGSIQDTDKMMTAATELEQAILQSIGKLNEDPRAEIDPAWNPRTVSSWFPSMRPARRWHTEQPRRTPLDENWKPNNATEANLLTLGGVANAWNACESQWQLGPVDSKALNQLKEFRKTLVDQIAQDTSGRSLGPILGRLDRAIELYSLSTMLYPSDEAKNSASGSEQQSGEQQSRERLDAAVAAHPKSLWWLYRIARTEQSSKSLWNDALGKYRQMAAGVPDGSEPWLEARARTVCLLRSQGETQKADQLKDLVFATYPKSDAEWKKRFEGSND